MVHSKMNLTESGPALGYRLTDGKFQWTGESRLDARDIVEPEMGRDDKTALEESEGFLEQLLADGPCPASEGYNKAEELNIAERTLKPAKSNLGVDSDRNGDGWVWKLPEE